MTARRIVHIHIPKTAGTSVTKYLRKVFGDDQVAHFGRRDKTRIFRNMSREELTRFRCVGGHLTFESLLEKVGSDALYFTVLRDPFDLFVSYHADILHRSTHPLHGLANEHSRIDFLDIVAKKNILKSQIWYLSKDNSLEQATGLIEKGVILADTLPNLGRLLARVVREAGERPVTLPHKNRSSRTAASDDADLRAAISALYADDAALVTYVTNRSGASSLAG